MFDYNPTVNDRSGEFLAAGQMQAANTQAQMYNQLGNNIGGALSSLGEMYGKFKDKKDMLAGMDSAVGVMADAGALPKGFLNNYNQLDDNVRPFIFQAIASPMFQALQKKQGYMDYANAMRGLYGGGGGGGSAPGPSDEIWEF
jgi:hypothetical protein